MIGLVNSIGADPASRTQASQRDRTEAPASGAELAPILSAEQAANRVLAKAVEAIQFQSTVRERPLPSGDESDALKQAERTEKTGSPVGQRLDVVA